jgi:23S rRNA (cytidine1920-2'-O)/16S rRNA (cytidine1409-2'-O)-methyltransferase
MSENPFVSRAGVKIEHALDEFDLDVSGLVCADFGCNVGGFTDCLLQRGAGKVFALDTGYGTLAWKLRSDDRVVVMERTNALHADPPEGGVDLVTIDLAWTPQRHAIPVALKWLHDASAEAVPGPAIITLIKPHYELVGDEKKVLLRDGALEPADAETVLRRVLDAMDGLGATVVAHTKSPLTGRKSSASKKGAGNVEYLALLVAKKAD